METIPVSWSRAVNLSANPGSSLSPSSCPPSPCRYLPPLFLSPWHLWPCSTCLSLPAPQAPQASAWSSTSLGSAAQGPSGPICLPWGLPAFPLPHPRLWTNFTLLRSAFPMRWVYAPEPQSCFPFTGPWKALPGRVLPHWPDGNSSDVSTRGGPGLLLRLGERTWKFTPHPPWAICRSIRYAGQAEHTGHTGHTGHAGQESSPNFPGNQDKGESRAELSGKSSHTHTTLGPGLSKT